VAFALGLFLIGLPHQFGKLDHNDAIVVLAMGIFALSRCSDALSLDRMLSRRRRSTLAPDSGEYRWPVRAVWLIFAAIFFSAGFIKAYPNGATYVLSDTMAIVLIRPFFGTSDLDPMVSWGLHIAASPYASRLLAFTTIALECAFPLVLFSRWARWVIVPCSLIGQILIRVIMGPMFMQFWICYLFFVPWDRVIGAVPQLREHVFGARRPPSPGRPQLAPYR
jgi:hypothetical protein